MYLLDENGEWLTMRASVGLQGKHIQNDQRLLATSVADIEAMAGHAVVVTDPTQGKTWNTPEQCHSAVCVPISSASTILGTLWIFGDTTRNYSDQEVNILEIIAGRIAAELERAACAKLNSEPKLNEPTGSNRIECHPVIDPPFAGWKLEGQCGQVEQKFVNWDVTDDEEIRLTIGTIGANSDRNSASIFVDPLTTNFQAHGSVPGVSFWLLDQETGVVFDIDEWANPLPLGKNHSIVATTTADRKRAKQILQDFTDGSSVDELILCLSRS